MAASRGGIRQLTMSLADDWANTASPSIALHLAGFRTEQNKVLYEDREWVEYLRERIPLKRPGEPKDLDGAIVFPGLGISRYMTGQTILVDGGISTGAVRGTRQSAFVARSVIRPSTEKNRMTASLTTESQSRLGVFAARAFALAGLYAALGFVAFDSVASAQPAATPLKSLQIYFVDVEGGQATLFVAPAGQSLLIDTGWPGNNGRDADRIVAAAHDAGINKIDFGPHYSLS